MALGCSSLSPPHASKRAEGTGGRARVALGPSAVPKGAAARGEVLLLQQCGAPPGSDANGFGGVGGG